MRTLDAQSVLVEQLIPAIAQAGEAEPVLSGRKQSTRQQHAQLDHPDFRQLVTRPDRGGRVFFPNLEPVARIVLAGLENQQKKARRGGEGENLRFTPPGTRARIGAAGAPSRAPRKRAPWTLRLLPILAIAAILLWLALTL